MEVIKTIKIVVNPNNVINNTAPYFKDELPVLTIGTGVRTKFTLPTILDREDNLVTISYKAFGTESFTRLDKTSFIFEPPRNFTGTFFMKVCLKDDHKY